MLSVWELEEFCHSFLGTYRTVVDTIAINLGA